MEKLNTRLKKSSESGLFHDSRADSRIIRQVFNELHDKVNELIDANAALKERVKKLELNGVEPIRKIDPICPFCKDDSVFIYNDKLRCSNNWCGWKEK